MQPTHPSAVGVCTLAIEPVTRKASTGMKWVWQIKQVIYDRTGNPRKEVEIEAKSRREALDIGAEQIYQCLAASVELRVSFIETTGDLEEKTYSVDGTAHTVLTPRADLPPARCLPLPMTSAEDGQRADAGRPVGPEGRRPPRIGARPEIALIGRPHTAPAIAETAAIPLFVQGYLDAEEAEYGEKYLRENSKIRGLLSLWFKRNAHPLADTFSDRMAEIRSVEKPVKPSAPKPPSRRLAPEWGALVATALEKTTPEDMVAYLRNLSGHDRQVLAGKIRQAGVPPRTRALYEQAVQLIRSGVPEVVAHFLAYADGKNSDGSMRTPSQMRGWLSDLPTNDRRAIGGYLRGSPTPGIPERARDLYAVARVAPKLSDSSAQRPASVRPPTPRPPTPRPPTPRPPKPEAAPGKIATYATHYQQAAQRGEGSAFLAGLIPVVRSNLRKYLVRLGDAILLAFFDRDVPQARPQARPVIIPPAPVPVRPRTPPPLPPEPMYVAPEPLYEPEPEYAAPEPVYEPEPEPLYVPPAPPAPTASMSPDLAAMMAQMQAAMGSIVSAIDAKASDEGGSEKLRTRRSLFH